VSVPVERSYGPLWRLGGPLAIIGGLGGAAALVLADRRGELEVDEATRDRLATRQARQEYDDWITTAWVPESAIDGPVVEVESLEGLVDVAIDTDERVLESVDGSVYRVLHDGYVYEYRLPGAEPSGPSAASPAVDGAPTSAPAAPDVVEAEGADPASADFDGTSPVVRPAPREVDFTETMPAVERVSEPSSVDAGSTTESTGGGRQ
jgi:hypothetical protein